MAISQVLALSEDHDDPAALLQQPHAAAPHYNPALEALLVFDRCSDAELIRSVHFYRGDGMLTVVQQEFRLQPGHFCRLRDPVAASYCNGSSEQLRSTYKSLIKDEDPMWRCVLDFLSHCLITTVMAPRLSVSRNSALLQLPSLARDLQTVERTILNALAVKELSQPPPGFCPSFQTQYPDPFEKPSCIYISLPGSATKAETNKLCRDAHHPFTSNLQTSLERMILSTTHAEQIAVKDIDNHKSTFERSIAISKKETANEDWGVDLELGNDPVLDLSLSSWGSLGALSIPSTPGAKVVPSDQASSSKLASGDVFIKSSMDASELKPRVNLDLEGSEKEFNSRQSREAAYESASLNAEIFKLDGDGSAVWNSVEATLLFRNSCDLPWTGFKSNSGSISSSPERRSLLSSADSDDSNTPGVHKYCFDLNAETATEELEAMQLGAADCWQLPNLCEGNVKMKERSSKAAANLHKNSGAASVASQQRGPTERLMEITLEELSQFFNMPITEASKELKVGLTVLKKKCRELRIPRWPHRKLKSLDSLIYNIQNTSESSPEVMDTIRGLKEQRKIMEDSPGLELPDKTKRLRQALFKASYKQRRQEQLLKVEAYGNAHSMAAAMDPYNFVKCGLIDKCTSSLKGTPFRPKMQYTSFQLT